MNSGKITDHIESVQVVGNYDVVAYRGKHN